MNKNEQIGITRKLIQSAWLIFGVIEGLIGLRFLLKLLAANQQSPFATYVYRLTDPLLSPFNALLPTPEVGQVVLETTAIIAMIVYALLAWVVVKLIRIIFLPTTTEPSAPPEERMQHRAQQPEENENQ